MKKDKAAAIAKGLTSQSAEALFFLAEKRTEDELKKRFKWWGHIRNALQRRHLVKWTKKNEFSLNADGRAVLKAL